MALLTQPQLLESRLRDIPAEPGCYLMRDGDDRISTSGSRKACAVGYAATSRSRHDLSPRIRLMTRQVCEIEFIVTDSEAEALALESNLIKNHQPHFNVLLKDDKKYPYLCITWSEPYPRIFITFDGGGSAARSIASTALMWTSAAAPHALSRETGVPLRQRPARCTRIAPASTSASDAAPVSARK